MYGEPATLGIKISPSTVWKILKTEGIDPAPQLGSTTWADFLRCQAETLLACDVIETVALTGQRPGDQEARAHDAGEQNPPHE